MVNLAFYDFMKAVTYYSLVLFKNSSNDIQDVVVIDASYIDYSVILLRKLTIILII